MALKKTKKRPAGMASRVSKTRSKASVISRKWLVMVMACLVSSAAVFGGYWYWQKQPQETQPVEQLMPIRLVEIQGDLQQVSKTDVLTVLRSQSRETEDDKEGINFLTTDLLRVEQSLEEIPWVLKTQVRRIWPDKLVIEVTEQEARAFWNSKDVVNRYGETFTPAALPELDLPLLSGPEDKLADMLATFQELQQYFEGGGLRLHELHLSERQSWHLKLKSGIELQVGRKDLIPRVRRFIDIYPLLISENSAQIESVDLRYDTGIAVQRMTPEQQHASLK